MFVVYDPDTLLPVSTAEEPLPPGMLELYQSLEESQGLHWFETPDGSIFNMCVSANESGALFLSPQVPIPYKATKLSISKGGSVTISGLPIDTNITMDDGDPVSIGNDTKADIDFWDVGTYRILMSKSPFIDVAIEVIVK